MVDSEFNLVKVITKVIINTEFWLLLPSFLNRALPWTCSQALYLNFPDAVEIELTFSIRGAVPTSVGMERWFVRVCSHE